MVNVIGNEFLEKDVFEEKFKFYDYFKKRNQEWKKNGSLRD